MFLVVKFVIIKDSLSDQMFDVIIIPWVNWNNAYCNTKTNAIHRLGLQQQQQQINVVVVVVVGVVVVV
jgi:hypothetical protein